MNVTTSESCEFFQNTGEMGLVLRSTNTVRSTNIFYRALLFLDIVYSRKLNQVSVLTQPSSNQESIHCGILRASSTENEPCGILFACLYNSFYSDIMYTPYSSKMYNSMVLGTVTELWNHHDYQFSNISSPIKEVHTCQQSLSISSQSPSPRQPLSSFLPLWVSLFWTFHINGVIQQVAF